MERLIDRTIEEYADDDEGDDEDLVRNGQHDEPRERPLVVLIESDELTRRALRTILSRHYLVRTARDGVIGLAAARTLNPDVVIAAAELPLMSGYHVCEAIKGQPRAVPVLLIAPRGAANKTDCLSHGADDCLSLPMAEGELLARVATLAKLCRQERALAAALGELEAKDRALTADLELASRFQETLLCLQPRAAGFDVCVVYRPLNLVGGDVYDVAELAPGRLRVFLGDASGHGVQAAFRTIIIKTEYDTIKTIDCPIAAMRELNQRIVSKYRHLGMWFSACLLDIRRKPGEPTAQVRYVNAGFPSALHVTKHGARPVCGSGSLLGADRQVHLDSCVFGLEEEDGLFAFTDGVYEPRNRNGRDFGYRRVTNSLAGWRAHGLRPAADNLFVQLESFLAPAPLTDDATLISLEMTPWE